MKFLSALYLICFSTAFVFSQNVPLYVGTFANENSKGIYLYQFNTKTGQLTNGRLATETESPNFLSYSPNKKYIYSVNRSATPDKPDYLAAFKVNTNGTLSLINTQNSHGKGPCHIAVNQAGNKVVVSNYFGGTVSLYNINSDGSLSEATQIFDHNTKDEKAHAHSALFLKNELFVADLGRNAVYLYQLKNNSYKLVSPKIIDMPDNPGPRHFTITKDEKFIYIINELGSSITSVKRTKDGFKQIDQDATLEDHYTGKNASADIHLSKDERFLYGSNRGENTIAVFKRTPRNGKLKKIQSISVEGNWPRNFTIDPTGRFLLAANRKSNNISVFKIDQKTGKLSFLHDTASPSPVCLLF